MSQLPPYLFGMINKMIMERRWNGEDVIDIRQGPRQMRRALTELEKELPEQ